MATCEICGTDFDDRGVQIVLPGLAKSFDRVDCAVRARNLAGAAAAAGVPMRGMLVDLGRTGQARSFALGGLSAGIATALAGSRSRVAVGGATVGVALLIATTAHLATRGGDGAEATGPQSLAPPARDAGDFASRASTTEEVARTTAEPRTEREVRFVLLAATRSAGARSADAAPSAARSIRSVTRTRTQRPKATRHARHATRGKTTSTSTSTRTSASTRPGWGHGDENHGHSGPGKSSQAKSHKKK